MRVSSVGLASVLEQHANNADVPLIVHLLIEHDHGTATDITHTGELLFGFIEENANQAGTVGGRFINATLTPGQTVIIPQGRACRI